MGLLLSECNNQQNSSVKHLKNLKKVIRIALANGWINRDPFMGITFKYDKPNIECLTREELESIINKGFDIERLERVRDIFIFCCFTGLAFADCEMLKKEQLVSDEEGSLWIIKDRSGKPDTAFRRSAEYSGQICRSIRVALQSFWKRYRRCGMIIRESLKDEITR